MQDSVINNLLKEAKIRFLWTFLCFFITCLFCYWRSEDLFFLLSKPFLRVSKTNFFICTQLTESLNTYLMISFTLSSFFCLPLLLYQIWSFFIPSCNVKQRLFYNKIVFLSFLNFLVILGITFALVLPTVWLFLYKISNTSPESQFFIIRLQLKLYDFNLLTLRLSLIAAFCSQIPIILLCAIKLNLISVQNLLAARKAFFFFSVLLASLISPPDFYLQTLVSLFIFFCIEVAIFAIIIQFEYRYKADSFQKKLTFM